MSEIELYQPSPIIVQGYEYDTANSKGRRVKYVCAVVLDTRGGRRVLRHLERPVYNAEKLEKTRAEVKRRAEEIAAWYRVTLR